tara:strand:+ start:791731 stop:792309 length:579 start_codon:yes stop_codon:yes gene_type:complete
MNNFLTALLNQASFRRYFLRTSVACVFLASVSLVSAQSNFEDDYDNESKPWQEIALQLPAPPQQDSLLPFYVGPIATQEFFIDSKSLSVGTDGVIRYTLVSLSSQGAKNITYEGIRCATFEKKIYASGHTDGSWSRSRRNKWTPIIRNTTNRQHAALAMDYFCSNLAVASDREQMIKRIKDKRSLTDDLTRF